MTTSVGPADGVSGLGGDLLGWLSVADKLLRAVERLAWDVRAVMDGAPSLDVCAAPRRQNRVWGDELGRAKRLRRCAGTLAKIVASYRLHQTRAAFISRGRAERELERLHRRNARRFVRVSMRSGGAFLKVGQLLSARGDLLPPVWIQELAVLQDAAPPLAPAVVFDTIASDLGQPVAALFAAFEPTAVAAASIGQVHRARARSGESVAVKVQRPGVAALVDVDLRLLDWFVRALAPSLPQTDYDTILRELGAAVRLELDYVREADVMSRVADLFDDEPRLLAPRPVAGLCGEHVLTATFIEGRKLTVVLDELSHARAGGDASAQTRIDDVLGAVVSAYVKQVLVGGVFQADPHPGNILVTADDRVAVLDFGCAQELSEQARRNYLDLMSAFLCGDRAAMDGCFRKLGFVTRSGDTGTLHLFADALLRELRQAAAEQKREPTAQIFARLFEALRADPVTRIPPDFVLLARVFSTLGGLFAHYDARIDFTRDVMPHLARAMTRTAMS